MIEVGDLVKETAAPYRTLGIVLEAQRHVSQVCWVKAYHNMILLARWVFNDELEKIHND